MKSFLCAECGEVKPARSLAIRSINVSGADSPQDALDALPEYEHVCQRCQNELESESGQIDGSHWGRSEAERWALSGLMLTKADLDWLAQYR